MKRLLSFALIALVVLSCGEKSDIGKLSIIPKPVSVAATGDYLELPKSFSLYYEGDEEIKRIAEFAASTLTNETGATATATSGKPPEDAEGWILLQLNTDEELGNEGYELEIKDNGAVLFANKPAGLFRGVQTLRQVMPLKGDAGDLKVPTGKIRDFPEYEFRSSMLDVSRHFFGVDDVKRYIDLISLYKMNHLHLHLSDDQGWRIEIKSWPRLTEYGSTSEVGEGKGGYYTQEQYKDIVKYAADRYVTVIPEIDMPGHTNAALASYPELNCNNKAPQLYRGIEVGFSTLCANKELTYAFVDSVVRELAAMTPGPYIHLGGDESHATAKEDYIKLVERVQGIVEKYGKKMIGWEEVAQTKLQPNTVIQYWSNPEHAKVAVEKGAKVIMSPAQKVYLDMKYDSTTKIGLDWAARIEVDSSYNWDPATRVKGIPRQNILGVEAPLWTETVTKMDDIEYLVFPRLPGIAELAWSKPENRNWEEYKQRLANQAKRMKAMEVDFYRSPQVIWVE